MTKISLQNEYQHDLNNVKIKNICNSQFSNFTQHIRLKRSKPVPTLRHFVKHMSDGQDTHGEEEVHDASVQQRFPPGLRGLERDVLCGLEHGDVVAPQ